MATNTLAGAARSASAISTPADSTQCEETRAERFDFENTGSRLDGLLRLMHWVERARHLTSELEAACDRDARLRAQFSDRGIAWANCSWEEEEATGLQHVLMLAVQDAKDMTAAGMAMQDLGVEAGVRRA